MKKILVIKTEHIGDYLLTLPALSAFRKRYPKARIDVLIGPWNVALAKATPYVDNAIVFENPLIKRAISKKEIIKELTFGRLKYLRLFKKINTEKYDLIVNFSDRRISRFFNKNIKSRKKICGADFNFGEIQEGKRMLRILEENGIRKSANNVFLNFSNKTKQNVNEALRLNNLKKFIIIHPFSPYDKKNWDLDNWGDVCQMKKNKKFVFIGTGEEKEKIDKMIIRKNIGKNCYNFSGKFDLIETAYLISKSKLFLGINSGPMYLADIFDVPTIILFGRGSNEKIWGLGGKRNLTLKKDSIKNISAKTVSEVAEKLLLKYNNF